MGILKQFNYLCYQILKEERFWATHVLKLDNIGAGDKKNVMVREKK